jgi:ribonuclease VapC
MSRVLDASAVLALIFREPGMHLVQAALHDGAVILSVNLAELITTMLGRGMDEATARSIIGAIDPPVIPFDEDLAFRTGVLRAATRSAGLSLGDRACLSLAERLAVPALTADCVWGTLGLSIQVDVIR